MQNCANTGEPCLWVFANWKSRKQASMNMGSILQMNQKGIGAVGHHRPKSPVQLRACTPTPKQVISIVRLARVFFVKGNPLAHRHGAQSNAVRRTVVVTMKIQIASGSRMRRVSRHTTALQAHRVSYFQTLEQRTRRRRNASFSSSSASSFISLRLFPSALITTSSPPSTFP